MKNFYKYLFFLVLGIIIYILLNDKDRFSIGIQDGGRKYMMLNKKYSKKRAFRRKIKNKKKNMQNGGFNLTKKIKKAYIKKKVFLSKKKTFKKNNNVKSKRN